MEIKEIKFEQPKPIEFTPNEDNQELKKRFNEVYQIKQHTDTVPTYTPKNFFEQIVFYENGATRKVYFYINNAWYSITVT